MREMNNAEKLDFSIEEDRIEMSLDTNFVFGHYQIGFEYEYSNGCLIKNKNHGFATVGGVRIGPLFYYSVSLCSPLDNFSKKIGRYYVTHYMQTSSASRKRGVVNIEKIVDESPSIVLKYALEHYLNREKHLPYWTKQVVLFRGNNNTTEVAKKYNICLSNRTSTIIKKDVVRHQASIKAWKTRRLNNLK